MPEISRFYGIVIQMYIDDHPRPHFHAWYGGDTIAVRIADGAITGRFPARKLRLIRRWLAMHRDELLWSWLLLQKDKLPRYIEPLD